MIPPSKPSGPQRGPGNQHAPDGLGEPEKQSFPDLQDGPDPAPPKQISRGSSLRKRVVKPSAPEYRPNPPSSTASSSHTAPSSHAAPSSEAAPSSHTASPSPVLSPSRPGGSSPSPDSSPLRGSAPAASPSISNSPSASPAQPQAPASLLQQEKRAGDEKPGASEQDGPDGSPNDALDDGLDRRLDRGPDDSPDGGLGAADLHHSGPAGMPIGLIRRTAVSTATAVVVACTVYIVTTRDTGTGLAALDPQAVLGSAGSLIAPATVMWWLWLPIVIGWLAYALYQWLPRQRVNPRQDWIGWLILASEIMALCWLIVTASEAATGMLVVGAVQTALGLYCLHRINIGPAATRAEGFIADVPLGMFLVAGVFSLTTSLAFLLTSSDADLAGWGGGIWAVIALISVTVGVNIVCMTDRGRLSVALAAVWALACVAGERLAGTPESTVIGAAAAASAFLVLVSAGSRRHQVDHERRRNERRIQA